MGADCSGAPACCSDEQRGNEVNMLEQSFNGYSGFKPKKNYPAVALYGTMEV